MEFTSVVGSGDLDVVVVGSAMCDLVAYSATFPSPGETIFGSSFEKHFGGKGANQAVQSALLGSRVGFVGKVGSDTFGDDYVTEFHRHHIDTSYLTRSSSASTGIACITVASSGANSIIIIPAANSELTASDIGVAEDVIQRAKVMVCQNEIPVEATLQALHLAHKYGIVSVFNPAPAGTGTSLRSVIEHCDIVCPNETELAALTASDVSELTSNANIARIARSLLVGQCSVVIVTLGERGALIVTADKDVALPAEAVQAVNTVGAGDSFIGTLACHLASGVVLTEAVRCALHCASLSVTRNGAQSSYFSLEEIGESFRPPLSNGAVTKDSIRRNLVV